MKLGGKIWGHAAATETGHGSNFYFDGAYKRIAAVAPTRHVQDGNGHTFSVSASGAADSTITWDDALIVSPSGSVGISTSDPKSTLEVKGTFGAPATSGSAAGFISRFSQTSGVGCLDVGFGDPYSWIQSRASNNYATNFDLILQPNGGQLSLATTEDKARMTIGLTGVAVAGDTDGATMGENAIVHLLDSNSTATNSTVMLLGGGGGATGQIKSGIGFSRESAANWGTQLRFYTHSTPTSDLDELKERTRITSSGTTGFFGAAANTRSDITLTTGTSDSSKRWGFGGGATGNNAVFYVINESNVGVYLGHGAQGWTAHSDERIKENITSVGTVLPSLMNMRCVKFNLISNPAVTKIGFIAQDWESAFPEVVDENEHLVLEADGTIGTEDDSDSTTPVKAMAYTETIPLLLKAIQEQQGTIEALTTRLTALEN
jgi:hypothetical protein